MAKTQLDKLRGIEADMEPKSPFSVVDCRNDSIEFYICHGEFGHNDASTEPSDIIWFERWKRVVAALEGLHKATTFGSYWQANTKTIKDYGPVDFVAIGDDWAPPKDYYGQMGFTKEWLNSNEITLVYIDRNTGMSSTTIRERLKQ